MKTFIANIQEHHPILFPVISLYHRNNKVAFKVQIPNTNINNLKEKIEKENEILLKKKMLI